MLISEYIKNYKKNEAQVRYNQSGYIGQSMSVRAKQAYDSGEMPKSKWTKSAIIEELENMFGEEEAAGFKKFSRQALFDGVCSYSSWHHTGKFANVTDFYSINRNNALLFAEENNITSMKETIENDEDYNQMLAEKEKQIEKRKQEEDKEKQLEQRRIEYIKTIYPKLPKLVSDSLSEIEQIEHRGENAYQFDFMMPNNMITRFHAYKKDLDELESLYNDLKNMKQNKTTKDIYKYICTTTSYSIMDGYDDWKENEYGLKVGDGGVWKNWNVKQLPLYSYSKNVESALS